MMRFCRKERRATSAAPLFTVVVTILCCGVLLGCDSANAENWILTVSPSAFTVAPGDSFEVLVRGEYTSGSSGGVRLSLVEPSPSGAPFDSTVARFTRGCELGKYTPPPPPSFSVQSGTGLGYCTVFIHIGPAAPQGEYEIVVRGDFFSDEAMDDSNPIFVTVESPPGPFSLWASGSSEIPNGGTLPLAITLTREVGFTGPVDLSVANLPAGITGVFDPATIPSGATASTVTLSNTGAALGDYTLQIVGTDPNGGTATVDYTITATEALASGWNVIQEAPDVGQFRDLDCPSSSVCYAVGDANAGGPAAYRTMDGGQTWTRLALGVSGEAFAVQFTDAMTGYIGGHSSFDESNGYLLKTTNGGASWTDVTANMPQNLVVRAIHFLDADHGYAAGGANSVSDTMKVMYTADGGNSWTPKAWGGGFSDQILRIHFWSIAEGYVAIDSNTGQGRIYYTTNGGEEWVFARPSGWFRDVSGGLGVAGFNILYSTTSPGMSWSEEVIPNPDGSSPIGAYGVTTQGGRTWIAGSNGGWAFVAYKDGGGWTPDWNPGQGDGIRELYDIEMFSATEGIAIGRDFMARRIP